MLQRHVPEQVREVQKVRNLWKNCLVKIPSFREVSVREQGIVEIDMEMERIFHLINVLTKCVESFHVVIDSY